MLNKVYRLVHPRQFELVFRDEPLDGEKVIVRPTYLSICNADQRYYQGTRPEAVLREKLPMALIHEGIGRVVRDPSGVFAPGQTVVLIPNLPAENLPAGITPAENYREDSLFRGSGTDGLMQEYIFSAPDRLLALPENLEPAVAAFTEFVSVGRHAVDRYLRFSHDRREEIGVWGDGNMGYVIALLLKTLCPDSRVTVFGKSRMKLAYFTFADETCLTDEIPAGYRADHAFECVGGPGAAAAVSQMIALTRPEGSLALLGVTEEPVPVNTRMVLEKGLRLFGSSRSGRADFEAVGALYEAHPEVPEYLENLVSRVMPVAGIRDMAAAFDADLHKLMGKTVMQWNE